MRKFMFILAVIAAFAFDSPVKKSPCTFIGPNGVCFAEQIAGTGRCGPHMLSGYPPSTPGPCLCPVEVVVGDAPRTCMRPCQTGSGFCHQHSAPDLTDMEKATCTATVVPVCLAPAVPGSPYCSTHRPPLSCQCSAGGEVGCGAACKPGYNVCPAHWAPPLTDSIPK